MTILQQPDILSLSGNIKEFRIATTETLSFILKHGSEEIVTQSYDSGKDGIVTINVRDIVHSRLSFSLQESALVYEQPSLASTFTAVISGTEVTFRVIRSGVDRLADTATNFLTQNFLTWQPSVKAVTYYSPEFLTYYAVIACTAKLRAYYTTGSEPTHQDIALSNFDAGKAYTIPLQYASVAEKLGNKLPAYYDVWIESPTSARLTYIQRYYASDMLSEQEQWILFENSLGGIDTFRAYGSTGFTGDHTHNIAEIDEVSTEYRVDTTRKFQKNTGHLKKKERQWLLDFFPSQAKYIYAGTYLRSIVVVESNVTYTDRELPSNYTFTYQYADARPLLNLPRTDIPSEALNITVPSVGSFTVPPRLVEFPRLPLTEGALFPIQNPYSEKWSTATAGSISDFIAQRLSENYNGEGGVGHNHKNIDLLNLLSYVNEYLLVAGKKIKSGKSDESDVARELRTKNFIPGIIGAIIDQFGDGEMGSLVLRKFLSVPELRFNRALVYKGKLIISPGGGCLIESFTMNGNGTWTVVPKLEEGEPLSQDIDDILLAYWHDKDVQTGAFKGFREMKFRVVSVDSDARTFVITPKPDSLSVPAIAMTLAQVGNFTNVERQTYIMIDSTLGNNNITFFDDCNTWDVEEHQEKSWFGKKKGRTVAGIDASVYSAVLKNIIMSGLIFQIDEISGDLVRVPCDKNSYKPGDKCAYYDRVPYDGGLWLCVNNKGTIETPQEGHPDWLNVVKKGATGESIRMLGHWNSSMRPVPANCMVSYHNGIYLSLRETNQAPVCSLIDKEGNYLTTGAECYIIVSDETNEDWELILENGKNGTSILFQGSFSSAPANPLNGWSYYNTSDKRSYVYQGGNWYVTTIDGKDGKDFEWIYTRTTTNDKPAALESIQEDDYVPTGWTDDPQGCTAELPFEWTCKRVKKDGVWQPFSAASIFNMYVVGETGPAGIIPCGHWQSANIPYKKTSLVTLYNATFVALVDTSSPPLWLMKWGPGPTDYLTNSTGGYTPLGGVENNLNPEWLMLTPPPVNGNDSSSFWLTCPVSTININSVGSPSPSSVLVSCKKQRGEEPVKDCADFYLVARKYNGSWLAHVSATKSSSIGLSAVAGYTQFAVRAYNSATEADAWSSGFISELGIGVVKDGSIGQAGPAGSFPRDKGEYKPGESYVWSPSYRDKIIYAFDGVYHNFIVANYGATVTAAPTSANGDALWEAMGKYRYIITDLIFSEGANIALFMFKNGILRSQDETNGVPNLELDGKTGKLRGVDVELSGKIEAKEDSRIAGMTVVGNSLRGVQAIMGIYKHQISGNGSVADRDIIVNNILQQQTYLFSITSASNDIQVRLPSHHDMMQKGIEQYQFEITIVLDNGSTGSAILFRCNDDALIVHGLKSFSTYGLGKGGVLKLLYFQNRYYLVSNSYAQTSPW